LRSPSPPLPMPPPPLSMPPPPLSTPPPRPQPPLGDEPSAAPTGDDAVELRKLREQPGPGRGLLRTLALQLRALARELAEEGAKASARRSEGGLQADHLLEAHVDAEDRIVRFGRPSQLDIASGWQRVNGEWTRRASSCAPTAAAAPAVSSTAASRDGIAAACAIRTIADVQVLKKPCTKALHGEATLWRCELCVQQLTCPRGRAIAEHYVQRPRGILGAAHEVRDALLLEEGHAGYTPREERDR
jgi:hypothetical protein